MPGVKGWDLMGDLIVKLPRQVAEKLYHVMEWTDEYIIYFVDFRNPHKPGYMYVHVPRADWLQPHSIALICLTVQ